MKKCGTGWQVKSLGEVAELTSGGTPSRDRTDYFVGSIPWVKSGELNNNIIQNVEERISDEAIKNSSAKLFPKGSLLIALYGATVGRLGILGMDAATNQAVAAIKIKTDLEINYLFWFLFSYRTRLLEDRIGGAQPNISLSILKDIKVPLPPLPIQKQIAGILEKADQAKQKRKEANKLTEQFLQSAFIEMFGDPVGNPKGWEVKRFDETTEIIMGQSPLGDTYNEVGNGSPLLNGPAEFGKKYPVEVQWTTKPTKMSKVNDVLFCVRGATAGRMNWSDKEYCIGRGLAAIRSRKNSKIEVIYFFLKIKYSQFQSLGQGSTFINLSKDLISSMKIPVPPIRLQQQFAELVQKTEALKEKQKASEKELENLFNSLMQKAFKGELT